MTKFNEVVQQAGLHIVLNPNSYMVLVVFPRGWILLAEIHYLATLYSITLRGTLGYKNSNKTDFFVIRYQV